MKTVFFGNGKYVIPAIEVLNNNFSLLLVVTTEKLPTQPVSNFCRSNDIKHLSIFNASEPVLFNKIDELKSELGVLANFGLKIPEKALGLFPKGILNIHPSLLPKYRGPTPGQTAILNGETETGVTIIKLDNQIDHGPILASEHIAIEPHDTADSIYNRLFKLGSNILEQNISKYINNELNLSVQDETNATFTKVLSRNDGFFDLTNPLSHDRLERMIRAYYPWPGVYTKLKIKNEKLKIIKFLPENKLQVEGKRPVGFKDFINGYPETPKELLKIIEMLKN